MIVEGELNALSCYQASAGTHLHVLSLGSEGQRIPPSAPRWMQGYGQVFVWADAAHIAQRLMATLPGVVGLQSPGGQDANDLLQAGLLGGFLAAMRVQYARSHADLERFYWDLWDAHRTPDGIDAGTATVLHRLAHRLGKHTE